jgi:hypothetical protein
MEVAGSDRYLLHFTTITFKPATTLQQYYLQPSSSCSR